MKKRGSRGFAVLVMAAALAGGVAACAGEGAGRETSARVPAAGASGGVQAVDLTITGRVTLLAPGKILVEDGDARAQAAWLAETTTVTDRENLVCGARDECGYQQLEQHLKNLKAKPDAAFHAKVEIEDGIAVRVDEVTA